MAHWIWYPGSFELYHSMLLHNRRISSKRYKNGMSSREGQTEAVYYHPFWRADGPRHNAILEKEATTTSKEEITFYANTEDAQINVDGLSYPPNTKITIPAGKHKITLKGFKAESFPAFFVDGDVFKSDRSYKVCPDDKRGGASAGYSELYTDPQDKVETFKFLYKEVLPSSITEVNGGILYDFGREQFGKIRIKTNKEISLLLSLGESYEEALDVEFSYIALNIKTTSSGYESKPVALRYIFIPNCQEKLDIALDFEYLDLCERGEFECENELINKIWQTSSYTMLLNSREGFFDGIKRDRWVWSGDAYQSFFVNYYLYFDKEIVKRTLRILRGNDPIFKHINTIVDYSFYWLIAIWDYYFFTGDKDFVEDIYPEMLDIWAFISSRLDENGAYKRISDDWVFIDWSTFDSNGPMCAEQILLAEASFALSRCASLVGDKEFAKKRQEQAEYLIKLVNEKYWSEAKGAFVDDYKSGKENVTRHANILAILFDLVNKERRDKIIKNVIYNKEITPITTPYFEFFELDAMCKLGDFKYMTDMLDSYWGGMLRLGATTIWEEFDPTKTGIEHFEMYGGKYEKSLCHAWGASPIYLLGKYALGVKPTSAGYKTYEVRPNKMAIGSFKGKVPTPNGDIFVEICDTGCTVLSEIDGGTLYFGGKEYKIPKNQRLFVKY